MIPVPIHTSETDMDKVDTDGTWTINEQIMTSTSTGIDELMVPVLKNNSGTGLNNDQYKLLSPSKQTIIDLPVSEIPVAKLSITGIENTSIKKKKVGEVVKRTNEEVNKEKTYDQAEEDHSLITMGSDEESLSERTFKKAM